MGELAPEEVREAPTVLEVELHVLGLQVVPEPLREMAALRVPVREHDHPASIGEGSSGVGDRPAPVHQGHAPGPPEPTEGAPVPLTFHDNDHIRALGLEEEPLPQFDELLERPFRVAVASHRIEPSRIVRSGGLDTAYLL